MVYSCNLFSICVGNEFILYRVSQKNVTFSPLERHCSTAVFIKFIYPTKNKPEEYHRCNCRRSVKSVLR